MFFSKIKNITNTVRIEWRNLKLPNRVTVFSSFMLVVIFSAVCSVLFFAVDFLFAGVVRWILANV